MAEPRAPDYELAENDYILGMKYKDIATKYGTTINTVKSWKTRYWGKGKGVRTKSKSVHTQKEKGAHTKKSAKEESHVDEVIEGANPELTDKQRLFCIYYVKSFNAAQSYKRAYGCMLSTAYTNGPELLGNPRIQEEVQRLKTAKLKGALLEKGDLLQKYIDVAFSDITDFVTFGQREVPVMSMFGPIKDDEGNTLTKTVNYVDVIESLEVDGSLIKEIKQTKDGISIKLEDRTKAFEKLADLLGLAAKDTEDEQEDDGFMDALKGSVDEVWADEEI